MTFITGLVEDIEATDETDSKHAPTEPMLPSDTLLGSATDEIKKIFILSNYVNDLLAKLSAGVVKEVTGGEKSLVDNANIVRLSMYEVHISNLLALSICEEFKIWEEVTIAIRKDWQVVIVDEDTLPPGHFLVLNDDQGYPDEDFSILTNSDPKILH